MHNWILYWILLLNITASANSILQDTTLIRQKLLVAIQQKDTLNVRNNTEKYAFYGDSMQKAWVYTQTASFYLSQKQPELTIKYARKALYLTKSNKAYLFYLCQSAYFLQSKYNLSDVNKDSVFAHNPDSSLYQKSLFVYLLSQLHQYEWKEAKALTKVYFKDSTKYWDSIYNVHVRNIRIKSVKKAMILSYIFPGAGQIYAGYPLQGFISLIIIVCLGLTMFYAIKNKWYLLAYFMVFGILRRFYLGGAKFAEKQVYFHNAKQNEKCVKNLKQEIEKVKKIKN